MGWYVARLLPHLVRWVRLRLRVGFLLVRWRVGFLLPLVGLLLLVGWLLQSVLLLPDSRPLARSCCPLVRYSVTHCPLVRCPLARATVIGSVRWWWLLIEPHAPRPYQPWFQSLGVGAAAA
jgi:hypothetical protein